MSLEAIVNVNQSRSLDDIEKDCDFLQSFSSLSNPSLEENREILWVRYFEEERSHESKIKL